MAQSTKNMRVIVLVLHTRSNNDLFMNSQANLSKKDKQSKWNIQKNWKMLKD